MLVYRTTQIDLGLSEASIALISFFGIYLQVQVECCVQ